MKNFLSEVRTYAILAGLLTSFYGKSQNMIVNPGAETTLSTEWNVVKGGTNCNASSSMWRAQGGTSGYPGAYTGNYFFSPGCGATGAASGTVYEINQDIDMARYGLLIDAGQYQITFSGWMQSFNQTPADQTAITVEYLTAGKTSITSNTSGNVTNISVWQQYAFSRTAPVNTRYIRVRLIGTYRSGDAVDSYFDNISLTGLSLLPVHMVSFTTTLANNKVQLDWQTNNERNNKGFAVLKSADGLVWKSIGFVHAQGATVNNYSYTDEAPLKGYNYYRLVQEDVDGKKMNSETKLVKIGNAPKASIFPNPVKDVVNIIALPPTATVLVLSATGTTLGRYTRQNSINVSHLAPGAYYLKIEDQQNTDMIRFMKL